MTASDYTVIIAAIGVVVVNALGIFVQIVTAWRASDKVSIVAQKADVVAEKAALVATTLEGQAAGNAKMVTDIAEIHKNTNGNLDKLNTRLEAMEKALAAKTEELVKLQNETKTTL